MGFQDIFGGSRGAQYRKLRTGDRIRIVGHPRWDQQTGKVREVDTAGKQVWVALDGSNPSYQTVEIAYAHIELEDEPGRQDFDL
jgi:hypothetical protein